MGQYDLATEAALSQLKFDELAKTPGGEFVDLVNDLLSLAGIKGPAAIVGGASSLLLKVRGLAGASYADNLIYAISAVRDDLKSLYEKHAELRERIESLDADPKFVEAIAALALRAMHTSVRQRLKRLARIVVNGVKEGDLEPERLDDMTRAAVELNDADLTMLEKLYSLWKPLLDRMERARQNIRTLPPSLHNEFQNVWHNFGRSLNPSEQLGYRGTFARLQSHGMIQQVTFSNSEIGREPYVLLEDGAKFYERLQEIGTTK